MKKDLVKRFLYGFLFAIVLLPLILFAMGDMALGWVYSLSKK